MVIHDFNVISISSMPHKTYAPLIVNPNAVPAPTLSLQGFQPIARRNPQVVKPDRVVKHSQFSIGHTPHFTGQYLRVPAEKDRLGLFACKRLDHTNNYIVTRYYCQ